MKAAALLLTLAGLLAAAAARPAPDQEPTKFNLGSGKQEAAASTDQPAIGEVGSRLREGMVRGWLRGRARSPRAEARECVESDNARSRKCLHFGESRVWRTYISRDRPGNERWGARVFESSG